MIGTLLLKRKRKKRKVIEIFSIVKLIEGKEEETMNVEMDISKNSLQKNTQVKKRFILLNC